MRPIRVQLSAFGPYAGYEEVDFEAVSSKGLFLICGKTGTGKTMILDAITFALYGKSSGHGRDDFEAMRCTKADPLTPTFVRFEFENNGEIYLFERRLERKRKNYSASYNLMRLEERNEDNQGVWRTMLENPREKALNEKAAELIGLEYEQFRQVILLPQGQFEKLLTSNSDEKEKILTSIFGEEKWQEIAGYFYEEADRRRNSLKELKNRLAGSLMEEGCDSISRLEELIEAKKKEERELDEGFKRENYDELIRKQQDLLAGARRFADLHKAEADLERLREGKKERLLWEKRLNDARRAGKLRELLEKVSGAEGELKKRREEESAAQRMEEKERKKAQETAEKLNRQLEREGETGEKSRLMILLEEKRDIYGNVVEAERELSEKQKLVLKAAREEKRTAEEYGKLEAAVLKARKEYETLHSEHERLLNERLLGITGELAERLTDGEPCPVCGSRQHPNKARSSQNSVTRAQVEEKKEALELKYEELKGLMDKGDELKKSLEDKRRAVKETETEAAASKAALEGLRKNMVSGIDSLEELKKRIADLAEEVSAYQKRTLELKEEERRAKEAWAEARSGIAAAGKEVRESREKLDSFLAQAEESLRENGFASREEALSLMLSYKEEESLSGRIAGFDASLSSAERLLSDLREELKDKTEPDEQKCRELLDGAMEAKSEYARKKAVLSERLVRLEKKAGELKREGALMEERIREAEEDLLFAKKLRGDSGTGLQRYVLGIMFSSVIAAANRMLEMVHDGRYRLFRTDDKAQGSNKRGLELKVFDRNSDEHEGRFVSTLSGGEKFLVSLALSIGMSTIAQKSGIRIEALFIDEGFGSLDDESINDAMNVLAGIRKANGMVGIISHVQLLQDQIPNKLIIREDEEGSHIVRVLG